MPPLKHPNETAEERKQRRRDYVRNYNREWAKKNPERIRLIRKRDHSKNAARYKAYITEYRKSEKGKLSEKKSKARYFQSVYPKNKALFLERGRAHRKAHPEIHRARQLRWIKNNPARYRAMVKASSVRRKARLRNADVGCGQVSRLIARWRLNRFFDCYWCGQTFGIKSLHVDHIIPISKGGKHEASNVCRSCPACNLSKGDKLQTDANYRGQLLLC